MMKRSALILVGLAVCLCVASFDAALAQPAHSNAGGNGGSQGQGSQGQGSQGGGNDGASSGNSQGSNTSGNGPNNGGQGSGAQGNGSSGVPVSPGSQPQSTLPPPRIPDHEIARRAVESGAARPLAEIIESATADDIGEVIDARLVTVRGFLLYELKVLRGRSVRSVYFYAKSGRRVDAQ